MYIKNYDSLKCHFINYVGFIQENEAKVKNRGEFH